MKIGPVITTTLIAIVAVLCRDTQAKNVCDEFSFLECIPTINLSEMYAEMLRPGFNDLRAFKNVYAPIKDCFKEVLEHECRAEMEPQWVDLAITIIDRLDSDGFMRDWAICETCDLELVQIGFKTCEHSIEANGSKVTCGPLGKGPCRRKTAEELEWDLCSVMDEMRHCFDTVLEESCAVKPTFIDVVIGDAKKVLCKCGGPFQPACDGRWEL